MRRNKKNCFIEFFFLKNMVDYFVKKFNLKKSVFCRCCGKSKDYEARTVPIGRSRDLNAKLKYPKNVVRNQKYSIFTFIPIVSYFF